MAHTTMATSGGFLLLLLQLQLVVMMGSLTAHSSLATAGVRGAGNHAAALSSTVPCLAVQAAALLRLKRSFAASNASAATFRSWRPDTDCCHWEGVRCARGGGRVTSLDLGGRALQSAGLDPAVFDLTSLMYLNLAYNDFTASELPSTGFEKLTELTHLNLSSSNFSGVIPSSIGRLTSLISLDLSVDYYYRDLPDGSYEIHFLEYGLVVQNFEALIANLKNLRELRLDLADISSSRVEWCDTIAKYTPNLQVLSLPLCYLSGPICGSFSRLHSLVVLNLQNSGFNSGLSGPIPSFFANFSSLEVLQISGNSFTGWFPSVILEQRNLVTVDLSNNDGISGILPDFSADSRLQNIFVSLTNFSGAIPSSVGNLKYLKKLDLGANGFSGIIPSSIGRLKSLDLLALSGYGLEGTIPTWIANLTSLTVLKLSKCGLSGSIPSFMGNFRKLKELTLSSCKFSGNIPSFISNLTQLHILNLQSNNFVGTVELSSLLWKLQKLSMLSLSKNRLLVVDREHNSSSVYPKIYTLYLASCSIDEFPKALRFLDNIRGLDLSCNQIQGEIPKWVWDNWSGSGFIFMNLSHNKFTSLGFDTFLPLSIDVFDLSFNMFQGPIPILQYAVFFIYSNNMFTSIPFNISLDGTYVFMASRNNISGGIPTSFCSSSLEILDLSWNNLNGPVPSCLMDGTSNLKVLNLKRNQIHGELPRIINESCSLEFLNFGDNQISGQLPRSLIGCKNLEVLDIQNNQISDSFPCWISALGRLQVLVLKSNKLFGEMELSILEDEDNCKLPSVRILDLSSNNLSGALTEEWFAELMSMMAEDDNDTLGMEYPNGGQVYEAAIVLTYKGSELTIEKIVLRIFVFLDISNNAFQGSIPATIGKLVLLNMLNMSHNYLAGPIPPQIGHLTQLEALDMSSNELVGEIPLELAALDFLEYLNLSYNKLVGSIPESPHFMTFSNTSFLGNDGLCGAPLSKVCVNMAALNRTTHHYKKEPVDIVLFLLAGIGFGVGFALAIVVAWVIPIRKRS